MRAAYETVGSPDFAREPTLARRRGQAYVTSGYRGLRGISFHEWVTKQRHPRCLLNGSDRPRLLLEPGTADELQRRHLIGCDPVETTTRSESFSEPRIDKRSVFLNREDANRSIPSVERVQKLPVSAHRDV